VLSRLQAFIVVGVAALFLQQASDRVRTRSLLREAGISSHLIHLPLPWI
jgi:hypothetical protein